MILDLVEIWVAVTIAFAGGAFAGALLHDWLARGPLAVGQAALADLVAMAVDGSRRAFAARRAKALARLSFPRGRPPPADAGMGAPTVGQLDRIRGLDPTIAATLARAGYARLEQVARWSPVEQVWIADRLAVPRPRVGRWVARAQRVLRREQAALEAPPKEPPAKKPHREKEPLASAEPAKPVAETSGLTPYEIALDLKLREP